jgi:hypothetical protein
MAAFYWRWLKTALRHSIGPIDLWTGLVAAILGLLDHYLPQAGLMTSYGWQVPIWVLAAVILVRLLLAPYWMWQEDASKIATLGRSLQSQKSLEDIRLDFDRMEFVEHAFLKLDPPHIKWLETMQLCGRPTGMPESVGQLLEKVGLIERDFNGWKGIKDELKEAVAKQLTNEEVSRDVRAKAGREFARRMGQMILDHREGDKKRSES